MQVHNIQSNNYTSYNSPKFGALNVTKAGEKMINSWYGKDAVWQKINIWKEELAKTKYFDLEIDELCNGMWLQINDKDGGHWNCEAPLRVEDKPKGKNLCVFGTDLIDCGDWVTYPLEFASVKEAENAYNTLKKYQHDHSRPTLEEIEWAVDSVKILERGTDVYMTRTVAAEPASAIEDKTESKVTETADKADTKIPFRQRLRNAWLALKG